ncbi:MAG: RsmE family RNA methyltransferase [Acidobacteriota bacterium]|nr:RsmE family RNA methyltransferase [Acidobacteriota bacterium]
MPGDAVVLIDGTGAEADAEILPGGPGAVMAAVLAVRRAKDRDAHVWLGVCAVRSERLAWVAEKAGELGVARLAVVQSERAQAFRGGAGTVARLDRLAREAAKQSGGTRWMQCEGPLDFAGALSAAPGAVRAVIDFSGDDFPRSGVPESAALLVGPEGGWTPAELEAARAAGWRALRLPTPMLRAETAAIAAVVLAIAGMDRKTSLPRS